MTWDPDVCIWCLDTLAHFGLSAALAVVLAIPLYRRPWWHIAGLVTLAGLGYEVHQGLTVTQAGVGFGFGPKDLGADVVGAVLGAWATRKP